MDRLNRVPPTTSPRKSSTTERIRAICLDLPEAVEKPFGGHNAPAYRVRDKFFVMTAEDGSSMTLKAAAGEQQALLASNPARFFYPRYVGSKGWIGVRLDRGAGKIDWDEITELVMESYCAIAPKRLGALVGQDVPDEESTGA